MDIDYLTVGLVILSVGVGYVYGVRRTKTMFETGELYIDYGDDEYYDEENQPIGDDILSYIEVHDDTIFMYKANTHEYLSHGDDIESLQDRLKDRFPNKRFAITQDNLEDTGII